MYHLVYLTTNLVNNKIYVGVHSTYNLDDGYLGTGQNIKRAIRKYGKQNFKRDILYQCVESIHAYDIEKSIVTKDFINRDDVYNINLGGILIQTDVVKYKISKALRKYTKTDDHKKNISESWKIRNANRNSIKRRNSALKGEETKRKFIHKLTELYKTIICYNFFYKRIYISGRVAVYNRSLDRHSYVFIHEGIPQGYELGSKLYLKSIGEL
jgi:hypothetical protein